ncbi:MAG: hypothetical protein JXR94_22890 [Candidatus Hydrogenedentes bacterium]|nr:hypothetical protein [Candidatus Hydrogenedentota bacterium]
MSKFFVKLAGFLVLVLLAHIGTSFLFPVREVVQYRRGLRKRFEAGQPVAFFGDSCAFSWNGEADMRSTPVLLDELLPGRQVADFAMIARNMDDHLQTIRFMEREGYRPEFAVIEVNLRAFAEPWQVRPQFRLTKEKLITGASPLFLTLGFRPLSVFKVFELAPVDAAKAAGIPIEVEGIGAMPFGEIDRLLASEEVDMATRIALLYRVSYMLDIQPSDPEVAAMQACARLLKRMGVTPLFFFEPIPYDVGNDYVGPEFAQRVQDGLDRLTEFLRQEGVEPVDLSHCVELGDFLTDPVPNDHLAAAGRLRLAECLAAALCEAAPPSARP